MSGLKLPADLAGMLDKDACDWTGRSLGVPAAAGKGVRAGFICWGTFLGTKCCHCCLSHA